MSLHGYEAALELRRVDTSFGALIMAAMFKADDVNLPRLKAAWPDAWEELEARHNAPGGFLVGEQEALGATS